MSTPQERYTDRLKKQGISELERMQFLLTTAISNLALKGAKEESLETKLRLVEEEIGARHKALGVSVDKLKGMMGKTGDKDKQ